MFAPNMYQNIIYIHVLLVIQIMSIPDFDNIIFCSFYMGSKAKNLLPCVAYDRMIHRTAPEDISTIWLYTEDPYHGPKGWSPYAADTKHL